MIETIRTLARTQIPLAWVWIGGTALVGVVAWCVQLQAEVTMIATTGSPTGLAALQQLTQLQARVNNMETWISHVAINDNRLTKIETEIDVLQRERMAPR